MMMMMTIMSFPPFWLSMIIVMLLFLQGLIPSDGFTLQTTTTRTTTSSPAHRRSFSSSVVICKALLGAPICEYNQVLLLIPTTTTTSAVPSQQQQQQQQGPRQDIHVEDLTPKLLELLHQSGMKQGVVNVISRHTTTAVCINERESRLTRDMKEYFLSLAPPDERSAASYKSSSSSSSVDGSSSSRTDDDDGGGIRYYHNDIDQRPESEEEAQRCRDNGWDIDDDVILQQWRNQEPINAHSHLLSMLLGSSESIPVVNGTMVLGQWQSVLLIDFDGPRDRTVGVQFLGYM